VTKSDLIANVAEKAGLTKVKAGEVVGVILNELFVSSEDVTLQNIGTIKKKIVRGRQGHNPATGEKLVIPDYRQIRFSASKTIRAIN
jgi:nucleoid DNA-binding protein